MTDQCEMPKHGSKSEDIEKMLKTYKTVAVVGASPKEDRPSYGVAKYLQSVGYRIIPVNPTAKEILGEKCYPDLKSIPDKVEIVDVFRKPEFVPEIAKAAVEIGAKVLWMQEQVISNEAGDIASKAGLKVVMNKCIAKEYTKMSGS